MLLHQLICQIYSSLMPIVIYKQPDRSQQNNPQLMCLVWIITSVVPFQCKKHFGEYQCVHANSIRIKHFNTSTCSLILPGTNNILHLFQTAGIMQKLGKCSWQTRTRGEMGFSILFHFSFSNMLQPTRIWRHSRGAAEREKEKALFIIRCHIISFDMLFSLGPRLPALIHKYVTTTLTQRALKERGKKVNSIFHSLPFP